ncbi:MAG: class I SAM-dependent methyltransferase, partial [Calditrichia bacterium]
MAERHFYEQKKHTSSYLLPYFEKHLPDFQNFKILEIGCAEAGFLDVLYEMGIQASGLEIEPHRVELAKSKNPNLKIIPGDITSPEICDQINDTFDLIVMRDVIEHIRDRKAAFQNINKLLEKNGYLYITFPPKYSGFAGHQQNGKSILRYMPYVHLLPASVLRFIGKILNEKTGSLNIDLEELK